MRGTLRAGGMLPMLVRNREDVEPVTYSGDAKGVEMRPLITEREGAPTFAMRVFRLDPGGHTPHHAHDWEHQVYILAGEGSVHSTHTERALRPGDSVYVAPHEDHQFRAGPHGLEFICCVPHRK
jgi:quercetin dioxygenase-like cupin family protein